MMAKVENTKSSSDDNNNNANTSIQQDAPQILMSVPTKQADGSDGPGDRCAINNRARNHSSDAGSGIESDDVDDDDLRRRDPFLYYSNYETRMNHILGRPNPPDRHRRSASDGIIERKTRLSMEAHDSLLLEDLLLEMDLAGLE